MSLNKPIYLSSPTMHGEEKIFVEEAIASNWVTTEGVNIHCVESALKKLLNSNNVVSMASGTAAMHMALRVAGSLVYGNNSRYQEHVLCGKKVFCQDLTFVASVNPVLYEGGEVILIDSEYDTWNMDPAALEKAFAQHPDVRLVVVTHLFGTPAKMDELLDICRYYKASIIEDSAESLGAKYLGEHCGTLGYIGIISFNGNKIITGSSGGALVSDDKLIADRVRKWSNQSKESMPWYQHIELGFNYRMSNIVAGVLRGQLLYLDEHLKRKAEIYNCYLAGLNTLPLRLNPYEKEKSQPNHWLTCLLIDEDVMYNIATSRSHRKISPEIIINELKKQNIEARRIWKPMHCQPLYEDKMFYTKDGLVENNVHDSSVSLDIFRRGMCLPSDIKMSIEQQNMVIEIINDCFREYVTG